MKKIVVLLAVLLVVLAPTVAAQSPEAQKLYTKIYCPLCGGVRLDVCELKVCEDMRQLVVQKLAAGESEQQIIEYFRKQYGDQVLGYPPTEGINWLAWLLPFALVVIAGLALWRMAASWTHSATQAQVGTKSDVPTGIAARIEQELEE